MTARNWLEEFLNEAEAARLCHKCYCTTCGAVPFRNGLRMAVNSVDPTSKEDWWVRFLRLWLTVPRASRADFRRAWNEQQSAIVTEALIGLSYMAVDAHFDALRLIMLELQDGFYGFRPPALADKLGTSPAGMVLHLMKEHARQREYGSHEANMQRDQEQAKLRRAERARQHALRLEAKKVRDAIRQKGRS